MSEVYILFGASVAVMFLAIVTLYVVVNYHKTLKRQRELEGEVATLRAKGSEEARKLILNAQLQATEVIKNAEVKAQELINASEIFSKEYKQSFQAGLEQETNKMLLSMSKSISSQVDSEVNALHKAMTIETAKVSESVGRSITAAYAQAQAQVDEYKKAMMEKVNASIFDIISTGSKKFLKETISPKEQQKLVMKALEEAKNQNVF